jgi:hypothetical protein
MTRTPTILLGALVLGGCATAPDDPASNPEAAAPLACINKAQCDLYWQRAQAWIAANSAYRVQNVTDTVIQTYGPIGATFDLAYTVVKTPSADGSGRIAFICACGNLIRCEPTKTQATIEFKRFVKG